VPQDRDNRFPQACAVETHVDMSQEPHCARIFTGKMPRPKIASQTLREPAQSKRTWTCRQEQFLRDLQKKCQKPDGAPTDQAPALTPTAPVYRKNPSVWTRGLGENVFKELCGFTPWTPVLVCPATKNEGASC